MNTRGTEPLADTDFFAGRDDELTALRDLLTRLATGVGGAVLIEGEQGIGKSALLRRVLGGAGARFRLAWGTTDEVGQQIPLLLIRESLGGMRMPRPGASGTASSPLPAGYERASAAPARPGDPVLAEMERLIGEVERLCQQSPVVLVTEDLQWADDASLLVWQRLTRTVLQLPLLLAGTCRPALARPEMSRLRRELLAWGGTTMALGPLPSGHLPGLVAHVVGARPGPRLIAEARAAGGNPLYIRELVNALVAAGTVTVDAGVAEVAAEPGHVRVPASLGVVIAERLSALPEETVTVLRWAAVLGHEFRVTDLEIVTGRSAADLAGVLDMAVALGVVTETGGKATFRHGLIRQQLYEGVPPARLLHSQAARALAEAGAQVDQVAAQLALAPKGAAEWVREWLVSALPGLAYRMPRVAGQLLWGVIAEMPDSDPRWEPLQVGLATAAFLLGQYEEVQSAGRRLLARAGDPDQYAEVTWLTAHSLLRAGHQDEAAAALKNAVSRAGANEMWSDRLHALLALVLTVKRQLDEAAEVADRVLARSEGERDAFATGYALHALSQVSFARGQLAAASDRIDRAQAVIGDHDQATDLRLMLLANQAAVLGLLDRYDDAISAARYALVVGERAGTSQLTVIRCTLASQHFEAGRWDEALAELKSADGSGLGSGPAQAHGLIALIAGYRDDGDVAALHLGAVTGQGHYLYLARAVAAERAGRPNEAAALLAECCLSPETDMSMPGRHLVLPALVRLSLAVGDADTAAAAARAAADEAEREPLPVKGAVAGHCRGLLTGDPAPVLAAAAYHGSAGRALRRADALTDAAMLLATRGDTVPARERFNEAVGLYRDMEAQWAVRSASARLRGYGIRARQHGFRPRSAQGWESLTPTETRVARLIADGRSNPEIAAELLLSRNTVQTHVSHILAKFGARSRLEVAVSAAGNGDRARRDQSIAGQQASITDPSDASRSS